MPVAKQDSKAAKSNNLSKLPSNDLIVAKGISKFNESNFLSKLEEFQYPDVGELKASSDFASTIDPECSKFFNWFICNVTKEEQFDSTDDDGEVQRLKEDLENLEMKCESFRKLNEALEMKFSSLHSKNDLDRTESKSVETRCQNARIKFSKVCDDLSTTFEMVGEILRSIETSCRKIERLCNNDEKQLTETLKHIADKLSQTEDDENFRTKNVDDLLRLQASFESLRRREIELELKNSSQDYQMKKLQDVEHNIFTVVPSPDRLTEDNLRMQENIDLLNIDLHNCSETINGVAHCFAQQQISDVFQSDTEAAGMFCQYLIDQEKLVANELKRQNDRLPQLKSLLDDVAEELRKKKESFAAIERFLNDKLAKYEQFKRTFRHMKNNEHNAQNDELVDLENKFGDEKTCESDLRLKHMAENTWKHLNSIHSFVNFATNFDKTTSNTRQYLANLEEALNPLQQRLEVFIAKVKR